MRTTVVRDIEGKLQPAPDTHLVKGIAQIVFYHLLGSADQVGNLAISETLPNQSRHLHFLGGQSVTGLHSSPAVSETLRSRASPACGLPGCRRAETRCASVALPSVD